MRAQAASEGAVTVSAGVRLPVRIQPEAMSYRPVLPPLLKPEPAPMPVGVLAERVAELRLSAHPRRTHLLRPYDLLGTGEVPERYARGLHARSRGPRDH